MKKSILKKYADLTVKIGVNIQKGQPLVINSPVNCAEFTRLLVESGYESGASYVLVNWNDDEINKTYFTYASMEEVSYVPEYVIQKFHEIVDKGYAAISVTAPTPGILASIDPEKLNASSKASNEKIGFYRKHTMANNTQWCVVAVPTVAWATKVFPDMKEEEALEKLWEAVLEASRVDENNNPIIEWENHMNRLSLHNKMLNEYNFKSLHFKNSIGTDLDIELVQDHIWGGGGEYTSKGVFFAPNIPTEETFTMPHKDKVNGTVVASKPLNYQGKLIEDFKIVFKDGKAVEYSAKKEEETLKRMLSLDEGSSRLGEVALISYESPISKMDILFYNTLFDENASCHLALGNAYTMNIKDGNELTDEELSQKGYNKSMIHVDFMFGTSDMEIIGTRYNGEKIVIFKNGNFVF